MKLVTKIFFLTYLLQIFYSNQYLAQSKTIDITGTVIDGESGLPIENAAVFISYTTSGALSDKMGEYKISNVMPGTYTLMCAAVGYNKLTRRIKLEAGRKLQINFTLTIIPIELSEIKIVELTPTEWERSFEKFKREFLGESSRTYKCEIANPEVLKFNQNLDEVYAFANKPIVVINKSLGYKINIYLKDFVWDKDYDYGKFAYKPYFEELVTKDSLEMIRWNENRKDAYLGSFRHFLRSCASNTLFDEGFRIFLSGSIPGSLGKLHDFELQINRQTKDEVEKVTSVILKRDSTNESTLETDLLLEVVYKNQSEDFNYRWYKERMFGETELYGFQDSWVKFPKGEFTFEDNGISLENEFYKKQFAGYWAWKRVSDLLPYNYSPSN
ncbi:MAG: carboxypeptidase-like regulatory domain-containing protein [Melioribacteraceae bacterium]